MWSSRSQALFDTRPAIAVIMCCVIETPTDQRGENIGKSEVDSNVCLTGMSESVVAGNKCAVEKAKLVIDVG